jgi:hypothetical protein
MDQLTGWLIVFCVVLACYIYVRFQRVGKKNKR